MTLLGKAVWTRKGCRSRLIFRQDLNNCREDGPTLVYGPFAQTGGV